jgi:hypothetical protein
MKKRFTMLCKVCLAFLLALLTGCSEDDAHRSGNQDHVHQQSNHRWLSGSEIPDVISHLTERLGPDFTITLDAPSGHRQQDLVSGSVDTDQILELTDQDERSSYSFTLFKPHTDERISFLNYVVKQSGSGYYGYIIAYEPDRNWAAIGEDPLAMLDFTGTISLYTDQGAFVSRSWFESGEEVSREVAEGCQTSGGSTGNNGGGGSTGQNGNQGDQGSNQGGDQSGTGGHNIDIDVVCGCPPQHPGGSSNPNCNCTMGDVVTITINQRSLQNALRTADPCPPDCFDANGDPCPFGCDLDGSCLPDPNESQTEGIVVDLGVFLALSDLAGPNDSFVYPAENVDTQNALFFNSVEEFEALLNDSVLQQIFPVVTNPDGTHTTRFRVRHGVVVPRDVNIWIRQILETSVVSYQVLDLETDYSGITLGTSWEQTTFTYQVSGQTATIDLYGSFRYNLFINDIGTIFTDSKHYQMQVNTTTGEPVSIIELNH